MPTARTTPRILLALTCSTLLAAPLAHADLPKVDAKPDVREMDANNNGRIEKDEYVSYITRSFEKAAGAKGYCTYEELLGGFKRWMDRYR